MVLLKLYVYFTYRTLKAIIEIRRVTTAFCLWVVPQGCLSKTIQIAGVWLVLQDRVAF